MALADTASRKLLHGAGDAMARGVAADGIVGMSFGLDGLWQLVAGLLGSAARLLLLPFEALWHLLQTAAAGMGHLLVLPFVALWHLIDGFFAGLLAAVGSAAHGLAAPFEALWLWLQTAAASITSGFDGLWQLIHGFFAGLLAALGSAAHGLAEPFELLWQWLQTTATSISSGLDGLWQYMQGILPNLLEALAGATHKLVLPFEAFWRWIQTTVADAAAGISFDLDGFWPLIRRSFANLLTTLSTAAHELVPAVEAFWRWLKTAAPVALPILLLIGAVACLVALVWFCPPILYAAMPAVCCLQNAAMEAVCCLQPAAMTVVHSLQPAVLRVARALVQLVCSSAQCLHGVAIVVGRALACLFPVCSYCFRCCVDVTMKAPGAAGMVISRAAFVADPRLYFQILRSAGTVVAPVVFSTPAVASAVAAPVAALFRP